MDKTVTLALKDLRLLSRDYFGLFWIFAFPMLFALFFGSVMGGGGGQTSLTIALVDEDQTDGSKAFIEKLKEKDALQVDLVAGRSQAEELVRKGKRPAYVILLSGFGDSTSFFGKKTAGIELGYDPGRKAESGFLQGMLMEVSFSNMQQQFTDPKKSHAQLQKAVKDIDQSKTMNPEAKKAVLDLFAGLDKFFNQMDEKTLKSGPGFSMGESLIKKEVTRESSGPLTAFEITFPSAIMWAIMGCITSFSISIVTERVAGTFLRLRIAPLSWGQLLVGKGLACFLACTGVALFLLLVGHFIFGVRLANPFGLILAILSVSVCFVGMMMLLATLGNTEQGVAGAGWGILMPLAMLGGGMIPLIAMPPWMQTASNISPIKWGIVGLEGAIWRGFDLSEMLLPCAILLAIGAVCFFLGIKNLARIENK
jgi:ABC-2 type transport system permease protein